MGANPVQVEMGEFEDGAEETVEEVVADSKFLPCHLAHLDGPCPCGDTRTSLQEVSDQGKALWGPGSNRGPGGNPQARGVWDRSIYNQFTQAVKG